MGERKDELFQAQLSLSPLPQVLGEFNWISQFAYDIKCFLMPRTRAFPVGGLPEEAWYERGPPFRNGG